MKGILAIFFSREKDIILLNNVGIFDVLFQIISFVNLTFQKFLIAFSFVSTLNVLNSFPVVIPAAMGGGGGKLTFPVIPY